MEEISLIKLFLESQLTKGPFGWLFVLLIVLIVLHRILLKPIGITLREFLKEYLDTTKERIKIDTQTQIALHDVSEAVKQTSYRLEEQKRSYSRNAHLFTKIEWRKIIMATKKKEERDLEERDIEREEEQSKMSVPEIPVVEGTTFYMMFRDGNFVEHQKVFKGETPVQAAIRVADVLKYRFPRDMKAFGFRTK